MISKIEKDKFSILKGRITNKSYNTTIKKLTLVGENYFVQIIPAKLVAGTNHLFFALEQTFSSFENETAFTKKPIFEFLVRVLAKKQLNKAIKDVEFSNDENLVLIIKSTSKKEIEKIKNELNFEEKEFEFGNSLGGNKKELMAFFGVSKNELEALSDLKNPLEEAIIERVAFVTLEK